MEKDWTGNKASYVTTNGFHNMTEKAREEHDYYATDPHAVEMLLDFGLGFKNVWENAVGGWHLAKVLNDNGLLGRASDLFFREVEFIDDGQRYNTEILDFMEYDKPNSWDGDIITNPPYKFAKDWAIKSLNAVTPGHKVALFLPIRYLEGKARRKELFDVYPPKYVYVSTSRIKAAMNGNFDEMKGSAVTYAWFIWKKGYTGDTVLRWFN